MTIESYAEQDQLWNISVKEAVGDDYAYRGELILIPGEVGDAHGHRKPPISLMRQTIIYEQGGKFVLLAGALDDLAEINNLLARYKDVFAPEMGAMLFVVNITERMLVKIDGMTFELIPMVEGTSWNEMMDMFALDKSDFKGQKPGQKVATLYDGYKDHTPKGTEVSLDEALTRTADIKREMRGAV